MLNALRALGTTLFVLWVVALAIGLFLSLGLWGERNETIGLGAVGKCGLWLFGGLLAVSIFLRWWL